jgi:hypothetical protein
MILTSNPNTAKKMCSNTVADTVFSIYRINYGDIKKPVRMLLHQMMVFPICFEENNSKTD